VTESELLEAFRQYRWADCWQQVRGETDDLLRLHFRACLLVAWWQEPDAARELLAKLPLNNSPAQIFLRALTLTCLADAKAAPAAMNQLKRLNAPSWMADYLALEYSGRTANYKEQAKLLEKIINRKSPPVDWCFVACLQSLENPTADVKPMKKVLEKQKTLSPLAQVLAVRVGFYETSTIACEVLQKISPEDSAYAPALYRLANTLPMCEVIQLIKELDKLAQTGQIDKSLIILWLTLCISHSAGWGDVSARVQYAEQLVPNNLRTLGIIASYQLIHHWVNGRYRDAYAVVKKFHGFLELPHEDNDRMNRIFFGYILNLAVAWQKNPELYEGEINGVLNVIGESHSLSPSNTIFDWNNQKVKAFSRFVMGVKMYHLAHESPNQYKTCVKAHIDSAAPSSHLLFTIGEIDTRPDEGMWKVHLKKGTSITTLVGETVKGYLDWLADQLNGKNFTSITIQGVPAPGYRLVDKYDPIDHEGFLEMLQLVNEELRKGSAALGWNFLDVYAATVTEDGKGNGLWHLDGFHLKPGFYVDVYRWLKSFT
jgi:hypothetical protein